MIVDNFLPDELAQSLRAAIDAHFDNPDHHSEVHQVWNYWYVKDLYTYLRTKPEKIIPTQAIITFVETITRWSGNNLEIMPRSVTWPWLSLYVSGCRQQLHNDASNGQYGYVYSLTTNDKLVGGRTMIFKNEDCSRRPAAGSDFFEMIEPKFNRLIIFDDKLPHAVELVEGSMDPKEGRFILHGHIQ